MTHGKVSGHFDRPWRGDMLVKHGDGSVKCGVVW